jgi:hypothetical protein
MWGGETEDASARGHDSLNTLFPNGETEASPAQGQMGHISALLAVCPRLTSLCNSSFSFCKMLLGSLYYYCSLCSIFIFRRKQRFIRTP